MQERLFIGNITKSLSPSPPRYALSFNFSPCEDGEGELDAMTVLWLSADDNLKQRLELDTYKTGRGGGEGVPSLSNRG